MGAAARALALAGLWTLRLRDPEGLASAPGHTMDLPTGEGLRVEDPMLLLAGSLDVIEERVGARPARLGRLEPGALVSPIGGPPRGGGVRLVAAHPARARRIPREELHSAALADPALGRAVIGGLTEALERQRWLLCLSAHASPLSRLGALLLRIAEERGVPEGGGVRLDGAPDVRELASLAGVSRESATINLEWLLHTGALGRERGRLWLRDRDALVRLVEEARGEDPGDAPERE
jgi:CRP-like cAMP-binding protein